MEVLFLGVLAIVAMLCFIVVPQLFKSQGLFERIVISFITFTVLGVLVVCAMVLFNLFIIH